MGVVKVTVLMTAFALSGVAITLLNQQLYNAGAADATLLVLPVPVFIGQIFGGGLSKATRRELRLNFRRYAWLMLPTALADVCSLSLRTAAQNDCGSATYTVIYASLPAFSGVLCYCLLGRVLSLAQWSAMFVVMFGLCASVFFTTAPVAPLAAASLAHVGMSDGLTVSLKSRLLDAHCLCVWSHLLKQERFSSNRFSLPGCGRCDRRA